MWGVIFIQLGIKTILQFSSFICTFVGFPLLIPSSSSSILHSIISFSPITLPDTCLHLNLQSLTKKLLIPPFHSFGTNGAFILLGMTNLLHAFPRLSSFWFVWARPTDTSPQNPFFCNWIRRRIVSIFALLGHFLRRFPFIIGVFRARFSVILEDVEPFPWGRDVDLRFCRGCVWFFFPFRWTSWTSWGVTFPFLRRVCGGCGWGPGLDRCGPGWIESRLYFFWEFFTICVIF